MWFPLFLITALAASIRAYEARDACNHDNCLRALIKYNAKSFCDTFLSMPTLPTPTYVSQCAGSLPRVSSACYCLGKSSSLSTTTSTRATATSASVSSSSTKLLTSKPTTTSLSFSSTSSTSLTSRPSTSSTSSQGTWSSTNTSSGTPTQSSSSSSTITTSTQLSTATTCPEFSPHDPLVGFTSSSFHYGFFGTLDSGGNIESASTIGIWINGYNNSNPDAYLDISRAPLYQLFYENGTTLILDGTLNQISVSDCNATATAPFPGSKAKRNYLKHSTSNSAGQKKSDRRSQTSINVQLTVLDACGRYITGSQSPNLPLWCQDITPALYIQKASHAGQLSESSPGVYSTSCAFTDTTGLSNTSPSCTTLLPVLENFCLMSSQSLPTTACQPFLNSENPILYEICLGPYSLMSQYCDYQTTFDNNYGLQGCLCGPLPATDVRVSLGPPSAPFQVLGQESSLSPNDISYVVQEYLYPGAFCGPCNLGFQLVTGPWYDVYQGSLVQGKFDNPNCQATFNAPANSAQGVNSWDTLMSYCMGLVNQITESNYAESVIIVSKEDVFSDSGPYAGQYAGTNYFCTIANCPISAGDFTGQFPWTTWTVYAQQRDVAWAAC